MTAAEALATMQTLATANRITFTAHAQQRAAQRHVRHALMNAVSCVAQASSWKVSGPDLDGDELTCVVVIEASVVIITLF